MYLPTMVKTAVPSSHPGAGISKGEWGAMVTLRANAIIVGSLRWWTSRQATTYKVNETNYRTSARWTFQSTDGCVQLIEKRQRSSLSSGFSYASACYLSLACHSVLYVHVCPCPECLTLLTDSQRDHHTLLPIKRLLVQCECKRFGGQ